jgi:hypothetical protein
LVDERMIFLSEKTEKNICALDEGLIPFLNVRRLNSPLFDDAKCS